MNRTGEIAAPPRGRKYVPNALPQSWNIAITAFFWLVTAACVLPVLLVFIISISDEMTVLVNGYSFFPAKFSLEAYRFLFSDIWPIARAYGITVFTTIAGTAAGLLMTACFAFPLALKKFRLRYFFSFFAFFTLLFNGGLAPKYIIYTQYLHLSDSVAALIVPLLLNGFYVLMMRTFFAAIPAEVFESAEIDGAGDLRIFFRLVLPLSLPALATIGLFYTLGYWNDWFNTMLFITDIHKYNIQYLMYKTIMNIQFLQDNSNARLQANMQFPSETVRMAMAIIGMGPIVFAYPFFQKYFVKGLTIGAVKG